MNDDERKKNIKDRVFFRVINHLTEFEDEYLTIIIKLQDALRELRDKGLTDELAQKFAIDADYGLKADWVPPPIE